MREIKFRAWNKGTQEMMDSISLVSIMEINFKDYELNNYEFMQYTGLKDKNGIEIFESDIINYEHTTEHISICSVVYRKSECQFQAKHGASYFRLGSLVKKDKIKNVKIIGNIYESPELLKGE